MNETLTLGVLGSGSGSNMQAILDAIQSGALNAGIACVISDNPHALILERAEKNGIPYHYIDHSPFKTKLDGSAEENVIATLQSYNVNTVILAGYMRIVKKKLLRAFPERILNIHPALLPAFPGLESWKQAVDYGARISGCTVHFVDSGTDTGPVILQRSVPVLDSDTPETLHVRIQIEEHKALPEAIQLLAEKKLKLRGRRVLHVRTP